MLQNREIPINEFIKITAGGIDIADYDQIQAALIKQYKQVYGSDIDLSNVTADGVFVNDLALIINNILQSFKILYANLDVRYASGAYLDSLCKLSNITRKDASYSTAQLQIRTSVANDSILSGTIFVDNSGNEWKYNGTTITGLSSSDAQAKSINVTCQTIGPIVAPAGSITKTLEASTLLVTQANAAAIGRNEETDSELRNRRSQSNGAIGVNVLESIAGALLNLDGIDDVQIINNSGDADVAATDTSSIKAHGIYAVLRYSDTVEVSDADIGKILYNKLTPGINTSQFTGNTLNGESKSYTGYIDPNVTWLSQTVYWKKAKAHAPGCTLVIKRYQYFDETNTYNIIANAMYKYLNNLHIGELPKKDEMIITAAFADPKFKGASTFGVVDAGTLQFSNPNSYYKYNHYTTSVDSGTQNVIMTFSYQ